MSQTQRGPSMLNRLLEEISWEGSRVGQYRHGGLGLENVLTAEVLMPLDFLPRDAFLGAVLGSAHGADAVRAQLVGEIEEARMQLLPDQLTILPAEGSNAKTPRVQPDALIVSTGVYALVEAKRMQTASFGREQLARELVVLVQECGLRSPLLLLILGAPPPVSVRGAGRMELVDAIEHGLQLLLDRTGADRLAVKGVSSRTSDAVAWITWDEISKVVLLQQQARVDDGSATSGTVRRLVSSLIGAIERHS